MTDKEIAKRFKRLVQDKGKRPDVHDAVVEELRQQWPLMYALVKEVEVSK